MKLGLLFVLSFLFVAACANAEDAASESKELYRRLGASLGTPAGLNAVVVVETNWTTLSLSGMKWENSGGQVKGIQFGASVLRFKEGVNYIALNLIAGVSRFDNDEWDYWGIEGICTWGWLFLQPGVTFGSGEYESPQMSGQFGVLLPL